MDRPPENPFLGRDSALAALERAVDESRIVTVSGAPGIGKSRLVAEARLRGLGRDRDTTLHVDLAHARTAEDLARAVSAPLGWDRDALGDESSTLARIGYALESRGSVLLVLDDAEGAIVAVAHAVDTWRTLAPRLTVVVTSRIQLRVPAERLLTLAPLGADEGRALYEARARESRADARFDSPPTQAAISALVTRLDGVPLAIELAAARARVLDAEALLARIDARAGVVSPAVLTRGYRTAVGRHESLDATMDVSWALLSDRARAAFTSLSLCHATFTLDDATALLGEDGLDALDELVECSLVARADAGFAMLSPIQAYGRAQLEARADADERRDRHAAWAVARTLVSAPDLEAAARWSLADADAAADADADADVTARVERGARALVRLLDARFGPTPTDCLADLAALADAAAARGALSRGTHADLLLRRARIARLRGQVVEGDAAIAAALALAREAKDARREVEALRLRAVAEYHRGDLEAAIRSADEALALASDDATRAALQASVAAAHHVRGDPARARAAYLEAIALARAAGDDRVRARALSNLGFLETDLSDLAAATRALEEALALDRAAADARSAAMTLGFLGNVARLARRTDQARACYRRAREEVARMGDRAWVSVLTMDEGILELDAGDITAARALLEAACAAARAASAPRVEALALGYLTAACAIAGDETAAREALDRARDLATRIEGLDAWLDLASAHVALDPDAARAVLARSADGRTGHETLARRILERRVDAVAPPREALVLASSGAAFWRGTSDAVSLADHETLRRLVRALAEAHRAEPGAAATHGALLAAGWPDERIAEKAAKNRLRVAIAHLRRLGLAEIETVPGGYRLDPAAKIVHEEPELMRSRPD